MSKIWEPLPTIHLHKQGSNVVQHSPPRHFSIGRPMNITESEIKVFLKQYEDATNTHCFSNVADLINSEATYRFTDGDFVGIEAIQKAFESTWDSIKEEVYSLSDLKIVYADENSAAIPILSTGQVFSMGCERVAMVEEPT